MGTIKWLPEPVRNSMRSGVILCDLTSVVEELVFNSLDAGATKVSVYVGVGTCYVKVVDDGSGISRDGLALSGERYVTSKLHCLADLDAANRSIGFRGEALASISDVSLLEIVTKACGRPNGFRKIMKGSKCLYLGVDDNRKDFGTTVVVHDLFYNQPVRRKCMQSSPKKVLHLVKKCVFRIALVHSRVSFKVIDIESDDELLCTYSCSVLSLLMTGFGIEDSSSLRKLNVSDGVLKLSGYVSCPWDSFAIKAFQYVYINSRFVCRGPIHKLLNHLASRCECLDPWKANGTSQKGKRSRHQAYPAYIMNLRCPSSLYDLTFEPSKTHVEFKDWIPILTFIEKAIQQLWRESASYGESSSQAADMFQKNEIWKEGDDITSVEDDFLKNFEFAMKQCDIQNHRSSCHSASFPLKMLANEVDHAFYGEHDKIPSQEVYQTVSDFKEEQADMEFFCKSDFSFRPWTDSLSKHMPRSDGHLLTSNKNFLLPHDYVLDRFTARERSSDHMEGPAISSEWQTESPKIKPGARNELAGSALPFECHEFCNELEASKSSKNPLLRSCSSRRGLPPHRALFARGEGFEFLNDGLKTKRRRVCADENDDKLKIDVRNQIFDILPKTTQQDETSYALQCHKDIMGVDMSADFDLLSGASTKSFSSYRKPSEEKGLGSDSALQVGSPPSGHHSLNSEWCPLTPEALFQATTWDDEHFLDKNACKVSAMSGKRTSYWHFAYRKEKEHNFDCDIMSKSFSQDNCFSSCKSTAFDFKEYADSRKFHQGRYLHDDFSLEHSDISTWETDFSLLDSNSKGQKSKDEKASGRNQSKCQDWEHHHLPKGRSGRSHSAPPFYRHKMRFIALNHHSIMKERKCHSQLLYGGITSPEADELRHPYFQPNYAEDLAFNSRPNLQNRPDAVLYRKEIQKGKFLEHSQFPEAHDSPVGGFMPNEIRESMDSRSKWRNDCQQIANSDLLHSIDSQHTILDISSGFLHLAGNSLVPESIHKNCLKDARVLQQVDKKFIPVVAGGTLAVIDQHAADERIRLEELRQKVLSGEAKTITYLDAEQELILPEIGYQLLHNYAEKIRDWGWICNIQAQGSGTFKKNLNILHHQPNVVTLLAVPCILGVNLSDGDLLEFLQQLADTDGSSTMPPSVLRVLSFKACRGAIMFGDSLLPSECALIVEELKETSLCFQCAHGRPTTVPLVNLEALHKQIAKLGVLGDGSSELWHGLQRQELSLERAAQRLSSARS